MVEEGGVDLKAFAAVLHAEAFDEVPLVEEKDAPFALLFDIARNPLFLGGDPSFGIDDEDADVGALKGSLCAHGSELIDSLMLARFFGGSLRCRSR